MQSDRLNELLTLSFLNLCEHILITNLQKQKQFILFISSSQGKKQ